MNVSAARVKIHQHLPLFERDKESRKGEPFEPHCLSIPVVFLRSLGLDLALNVKGVKQLGACLMFQIGESPIGLWIEFLLAHSLFYRGEPSAWRGSTLSASKEINTFFLPSVMT